MRGRLIVIDGTDGSGKGTQTKLIVERLLKEGHNVKTMSFPTYGTKSCKGVELYLNGELGTPEEVGPYYAAMLYAYNRAQEVGQMRKDLASGVHYVLDRYVSANAGHQGGKIADEKERQKFLDWVFALEFEIFKIPVPDRTILLHVPASVGQELVLKKAQRAYLGEKKQDVHEADGEHLKNAEAAFLHAAKTQKEWVTIECMEGDELRPIVDIHEEIYEIVKSVLK